ncbi:diguanylate cyclase [Arthrobacter livingstonensis]|uniref:Diguanylate cyclase n=1 Tax=Arthrobacter livingstonensis TaxID=670078 RepID=A0A2V5KZ12_9MICC|nr:HD domain-containing protein [Arthrobacter livingstonensis]PYI64019.1 diguanylate cyclase [Arthrobacter livingstonensis]
MTENIAGITIPDTSLVREITDYIRDQESELLYHHSRRVFLFGALMGDRRGLDVDLELLYAGAMFHDLGLTDSYHNSKLRFEVDSANAAREFLTARGVDAERANAVWTGIALHTTPNVPEFMIPEVALVTAGVETDVLGIWYHELNDAEREEVTSVHPRADFKNQILAAFTEGNIHRPESTFGNVNADVLAHYMPDYQREDFVKIIKNNAWAE